MMTNMMVIEQKKKESDGRMFGCYFMKLYLSFVFFSPDYNVSLYSLKQ